MYIYIYINTGGFLKFSGPPNLNHPFLEPVPGSSAARHGASPHGPSKMSDEQMIKPWHFG